MPPLFSKISEAVINFWNESPFARALLTIAVEQIKEDLANLAGPSNSSLSQVAAQVSQAAGRRLEDGQEAGLVGLIPPQLPIQADAATAAVNGDPYQHNKVHQIDIGDADKLSQRLTHY